MGVFVKGAFGRRDDGVNGRVGGMVVAFDGGIGITSHAVTQIFG
jgi:hypothetical protein